MPKKKKAKKKAKKKSKAERPRGSIASEKQIAAVLDNTAGADYEEPMEFATLDDDFDEHGDIF